MKIILPHLQLQLFATLCFGLFGQVASLNADEKTNWTWECTNQKCLRSAKPQTSLNSCAVPLQPNYPSITLCRLVCDQEGAVWPKPTGQLQLGGEITLINSQNIRLHINYPNANQKQSENDVEDFIQRNMRIFKKNLNAECENQKCQSIGLGILMNITVETSDLTLNWQTDESYTLNVHSDQNSNQENPVLAVGIQSKTIFGARHALETLTQLSASYTISNSNCNTISYLAMVKKAYITDKPFYPHRGLLVDTARNYLNVKSITRQIDALAASKMNVLHWHATDSQSFPIQSVKVPRLSKYGAYSKEKVYSLDQISYLVKYAKVRGVRIIMEIDAPAHAGNGWQWGPKEGLGDLAFCVNQQPWRNFCIQPPCGQLNPLNDNVYHILGELYGELIERLPKGEAFHMGGDELFVACWNSSNEIIQYLQNNGKGRDLPAFLDLWGIFQSEALKKFDEQTGNEDSSVILWSSHLTDPEVITKYLKKERYVVQTWVPAVDELPKRLIDLGYKLIISTKDAWYLDHGFWGSTKYHTWQTAYNNRILEGPNVLGGEVCSWGEYVDDQSIDSRVWPRAAAAGERLWSNPISNHVFAQTDRKSVV